MKKFLLIMLSLVFILSGCNTDIGDDKINYIPFVLGISSSSSTGNSGSSDSNFLKSAEVSLLKEINPTDKKVTLTGVAGKTVFLAKVNPGNGDVATSSTGYIESVSGIPSSSVSADAAMDRSLATVAANLSAKSFIPFELPEEHCLTLSLMEMEKFKNQNGGFTPVYDASSAVLADAAPSVVIDYKIGDTKNIWVIKDSNINTEEKSATLRAKGTNCYVWVIDDCYTAGTSEGSKVNSEKAQAYAQKFDSVYEPIRKIFGTEPEKMWNGSEWKDISTISTTGSMVNLVLYDISNYISAYGFFFNGDYATRDISSTSDSNLGKYLYIDTKSANSNFEITISTMVHEFQHMVYFSKDTGLSKSLNTETIYNEMLSMLCEDVLFDKLGISVSQGIFGKRIIYFNIYNQSTGAFRYNKTDGTVSLSYSNVYVFGAWLCRKYGGPALIKAMAESAGAGHYNSDMILEAVKNVTGNSVTIEALFKEYLKYLLSRTPLTAVSHVISEETFTLPAMNIWDEKYSYGNLKYPNINVRIKDTLSPYVPSDFDYKGPVIFSTKNLGVKGPYTDACFMPPASLCEKYGFVLHKIADVPSGTDSITLNLSPSSNDTLKFYIFIK